MDEMTHDQDEHPKPLAAVVADYEQGELFEGSVVDRYRYTLRVGPDLDTEKPIEFRQRVKGTFEGIITEVAHKQKRDGSVVRVHVIEVDDVEIA